MHIKFACSCGKKISADPRLAGRSFSCPGCKTTLQVPADEVPELEIEIMPEEAEQVVDAVEAASTQVDEDADAGGSYGLQDAGAPEHDDAVVRQFSGQVGVINVREPASCLAYSHNSNWAAAGLHRDVQILNMKSHKRAFKFQEHDDPVTSVAFTPSGEVVSGDEAGRIFFWDPQVRRVIRRLKAHHAAVTAIAVSTSGRFAVSGGLEGCIRLWELKTGDEFELSKAAWKDAVSCVSFSRDGCYIGAAGDQGRVGLWDFRTGKLLSRMEGCGKIDSIAFSTEGGILTGCGLDSPSGEFNVLRCGVPSGKEVNCWEDPSKQNCQAFMNGLVPGGNYLVSVGRAAPKKRNNLGFVPGPSSSGVPVVDLITAAAHIYAIGKSFQGDKVGADDYATENSRFQIWNVNSGMRTQNFYFNGDVPCCLAVSPQGSRALLATAGAMIHVFGLGHL